MTLMFTQGHRVQGKVELVQSLYCRIACSHCMVELHEAAQMFVKVDYVREMTVKKSCKYGEYGSFEYLFLLFFGFVFFPCCFQS